MKTFYRDPENIGWAGCVYINPDNMTILLVRNLKRETQIKEELLKQGFASEADQELNYKRVRWELSKKVFVDKNGRKKIGLEKSGKWELLAGGIAYWQGNPELRNEFQRLSSGEEREEFEKKVGIRVLFDSKLLEKAADSTAESEFVEECGLMIGKKTFLTKANDTDRIYPENLDLFYPRFWYLVTEIAGGKLREEPVKATISAPQWIPLFKLHPTSERDGCFPIHPSHCLGIVAAAKYFIKNGRQEFAEVVSYLEKTFGSQKEAVKFEEATDWESFKETVQKLN